MYIYYIYIYIKPYFSIHQDDTACPGRRVLTGTLAGEMTIWNGALAKARCWAVLSLNMGFSSKYG